MYFHSFIRRGQQSGILLAYFVVLRIPSETLLPFLEGSFSLLEPGCPAVWVSGQSACVSVPPVVVPCPLGGEAFCGV